MAHLEHDAIMDDIVHAFKIGYFERNRDRGPSEFATTPVHVLHRRTAGMSPERRRSYLASIGYMRSGRVKLSGGMRSKRTRLWLSK